MGEYIETTRETVTKLFHDFSADRIIELDKKSIKILNKQILEKISNIG